ncbi:PREDICTED: disintegrin and metalloproteinase domain-containing protein 2-like [Chrysochloris asiatica]|uniref:Disintegrin and metalloproteinase domain-containing protein 2-like n=1 Tax=Chrysochloris asiatica TaxID=185453 RepID=A0A9B0TA70_CHRAS|nr:PREDICTED: disintegrin and metalloproteinase domain-containing protein 2-like [Chrysochloris asiatica]
MSAESPSTFILKARAHPHHMLSPTKIHIGMREETPPLDLGGMGVWLTQVNASTYVTLENFFNYFSSIRLDQQFDISPINFNISLLYRNFLSHNFRVYDYNYSDTMQPLIQKFQNLCNYQGHIEGFPNSMVTISTCTGLRGLIQFENVSYGIEPLETSVTFEHMIYPVKNKNANYSLYIKKDNVSSQLYHKIPKAQLQSDNNASYTRYLEIHVVVEKNLCEHMGADTAIITQRIFQVIGLVSAMFTPFNVKLVLSSLELWRDGNKISISGEVNELLQRFLNWKNTYLVLRPHDVAFLLIYRKKSSYVGATLKGMMCDRKNSGSVALYSGSITLEAFAVIITQLLSLSMGISFDDINKCQCSGSACIMSPEAVHYSGMKIFSSCSMDDFIHFISKQNSQCLQNQPHLDPSYRTTFCGNKHLEDGEQCDCGEQKEKYVGYQRMNVISLNIAMGPPIFVRRTSIFIMATDATRINGSVWKENVGMELGFVKISMDKVLYMVLRPVLKKLILGVIDLETVA